MKQCGKLLPNEWLGLVSIHGWFHCLLCQFACFAAASKWPQFNGGLCFGCNHSWNQQTQFNLYFFFEWVVAELIYYWIGIACFGLVKPTYNQHLLAHLLCCNQKQQMPANEPPNTKPIPIIKIIYTVCLASLPQSIIAFIHFFIPQWIDLLVIRQNVKIYNSKLRQREYALILRVWRKDLMEL